MNNQLLFVPMGGRPPSVVGTQPPVADRTAYVSGRPRRGRVPLDAAASLKAYVYRKDVIFKFEGMTRSRPPRNGKLDAQGVPVPKATRGVIRGFSRDSARRLRFIVRNTSDLWEGFVTLTYPGDWEHFAKDGRAVKRHVNAFCQWLRRKKCAYLWVLEFQKRGAPHFHFMVSGYLDKLEIARRWNEIVFASVGGDDWEKARWDHLVAGTQVLGVKDPDQVGGYMGAYLSKLEQKLVPDGYRSVGRFWGASKCLTKTVFGFKTLYRDAARETRRWRRENVNSRRVISREQSEKALGLAVDVDHLRALLETSPASQRPFLERELRVAIRRQRGCHYRSLSYAKRWRWRGLGFVLLDGAVKFRSLLRQALAMDRGVNVWQEWIDEPDQRSKFIPLTERGQLMLDGTLDPEWAPDWDAPKTC